MTSPLRVGVIGCGAVAQIMHIPYLCDYDEHFEVVALADIYKPVLDAVGDRYQVARRYTDWQDLLANDDIDAVVIAHGGSHRDSIIAALDAGKHVFTEKPLTWNLREAEEVAERVAQSDRIVQVAYHKRYDPGFRYAREQVKKMDDLGFVRITVLHPPDEMGHSPFRIRLGEGRVKEDHIDPISWDEQVRNGLQGLAGGDLAPLVDEALGDARKGDNRLRLGYGIIVVSIIHQVYSMFGFLGKPERVISTDIWREGFSIHALIEYPNQVRCTIDWHFLAELKDYREEYAFYGNGQRVALQLPSPYLKNFPSPVIVQGGEGELAWEKKVVVSYDEAFRNELLAFHHCVTENKQPETTVAEAVEHMAFIQQLIDAVRE